MNNAPYDFINSKAKPIRGMRFFLQDTPAAPKEGFAHKASWEKSDLIQRIHLYKNKQTYCLELTPQNNRLFHPPPSPLSDLCLRIYGTMRPNARLKHELAIVSVSSDVLEENNVAFIKEAGLFYYRLQQALYSSDTSV